MKTNEELQKNVQDAIKWEPLLNAAEIGVAVKDGIVTLTGAVDSYAKKLEVEEATRNVAGVNAVVEKLEVKFGNSFSKSDNDIAAEILNAYKYNWEVPNDVVKVKVENGWVTLTGELPWNYQREAAKKVVEKLEGVKGVTSKILIKASIKDQIEKEEIEGALIRNPSVGDQDIEVTVAGTKITLSGCVNSWYQRQEAGRIAWNAPGVWQVDNELVVAYEE